MSESVDDLLVTGRGLLPVRAALSALCFAAALAGLPNLEDAGLLSLMLLGASGAAAALAALAGGAWVFDAPDLPAARQRADAAFGLGAFFVGAFCLVLLAQGAYAPAFWPRWGYPLLFTVSWLSWFDWPWEGLAGHLASTPRAKDLERYRVAEAPAPASSQTELPPGVEAMLVSSGSFRVDRGRMLKVLSGYQLADPGSFLVPWLRLAVASGAGKIEFSSRSDGLLMRFDGRPLDARFLEDPYRPLLDEESPDGERHKHLAYGLLGLLALTPRAVLGVSGKDGAVLRVEPEGAAPLEAPAPDPQGGTVLRVVFDGWSARLRALEALAKARAAWGLAEAELSIDGKAVPAWELEDGEPRRFDAQEARGLVYGSKGASSRLRVYKLGCLVLEREFVAHGAEGFVSVHASGDALRLDASQAKLVEDRAFRVFHSRLQEVCKGGAPSPATLRALAYTKSGLAAALAGGVGAFALFAAAAERRPDLAWAAGVLYAGVTVVLLAFVARWAAARLAGRRNPFRS